MERRILSVVVAVFALLSAVGQAQAAKKLGSPRELIQGGTLLHYHQPRIDRWQDRKILKARMAVVLTNQDFPQLVAGAL